MSDAVKEICRTREGRRNLCLAVRREWPIFGSFIASITLVKHAPVGPASAGSDISVVLVLLISVLYFGDRLSAVQIVGALAIMLGVVCMTLSTPRPATDPTAQ